MNVLAELRSRFQTALQGLIDDPTEYLSMIRPSQDPRFGDYQANMAMPLKARLQQNPREIAEKIVAALDVADICDPPEIAGPGFINLRLRTDWLQTALANDFADPRMGVSVIADPKTYLVDFSSPNVAKPMHVGHLRSSVIGDALCRILGFIGHRVLSDNHIGDWGTQFGMIIYGYKNFLNADAFAEDPVAELSRLYRLVNQLSDYHQAVASLPAAESQLSEKESALAAQEAAVDPKDKKAAKALRKQRADVAESREQINGLQAKIAAVEADESLREMAANHPDIATAAREETARLHSEDETNKQLWSQFLPSCLKALNRIYERLGISFDMTLGESFYQPFLADVVEDLQRKGLAEKSEGAICVFIEGTDAPFIVRKKDGAFTYATTDLATIRYRVQEFDADAMLYVVDARQSDHFHLLFETARRWGFADEEFRHVSFGTILGDDKRPFKTRSGDTVGLESLIDEAITRARAIVDANDDAKEQPELDDTARQEVAEKVGIGGIKYADLNHNRDSDYVFNWDKMLATNGDTATYMQYAHARVCGIFRKGEIDREALRAEPSPLLLEHAAERALGLQLGRFGQALQEVVQEYRPNLLTNYLFETANCFSTFYNEHSVLKEEDAAVRVSRLKLCDLTARILHQGLALLGIDSPERM